MEKTGKKIPDRIAVAAGLLLLLALGLAAILAPGGEFSEWERRILADRPGTPDPEYWKTDKAVESFLKDHIPARRELVALDSSATAPSLLALDTAISRASYCGKRSER